MNSDQANFPAQASNSQQQSSNSQSRSQRRAQLSRFVPPNPFISMPPSYMQQQSDMMSPGINGSSQIIAGSNPDAPEFIPQHFNPNTTQLEMYSPYQPPASAALQYQQQSFQEFQEQNSKFYPTQYQSQAVYFTPPPAPQQQNFQMSSNQQFQFQTQMQSPIQQQISPYMPPVIQQASIIPSFNGNMPQQQQFQQFQYQSYNNSQSQQIYSPTYAEMKSQFTPKQKPKVNTPKQLKAQKFKQHQQPNLQFDISSVKNNHRNQNNEKQNVFQWNWDMDDKIVKQASDQLQKQVKELEDTDWKFGNVQGGFYPEYRLI